MSIINQIFEKNSLRSRATLALPACACSLVDSTVTLLGQPTQYWSNHSWAIEANPMFSWLMYAGPGWFILGELVWCAVIIVVVACLPGRLGLIVAAGVSIGHINGALSWLGALIPIVALYPVFALFALAPISQTYLYLRPRLRKEA